MNIRLASDFDYAHFKKLFPELKLFDWDDTEEIDLLIFPGGEDVSPEYYMSQDEIEVFSSLCGCNKQRDEYEAKILDYAINKGKVNKILGVCRGTQFLNVMFSGTLFPDLQYFKIRHDYMHSIRHVTKSNLDFFKVVNSLHHQGIRNVGNYHERTDKRMYPTVIATDVNDYVKEIVTWDNDRILGIQFHPEYYDDNNEDKIKFKEFMYKWIAGEITILKEN